MRRILGVAGVVVLVLSACGKSSSPSSGGSPTEKATPGGGGVVALTVNTDTVSGVGTVLVNGNGFTLYHLKTESATNIQCTGSCPKTWPPLLYTGSGAPQGGVDVTGTLETVTRPDGGEQVTYNGLPLYIYSGDSSPGEANGQGVGGVWYAVTPSTKGSAGGSGGGYGYPSPSSSSSGGYQYPGG